MNIDTESQWFTGFFCIQKSNFVLKDASRILEWYKQIETA